MPAVLRRIRQEGRRAKSEHGKRVHVVLYSNPRGSNPSGVDTCTSFQKMEASAWEGSGALSWSTPAAAERSNARSACCASLVSTRRVCRALPAQARRASSTVR